MAIDHFIVFAPTYTHIYDIEQNTMTLKGSSCMNSKYIDDKKYINTQCLVHGCTW
jgi:hypothetical protein